MIKKINSSIKNFKRILNEIHYFSKLNQEYIKIKDEALENRILMGKVLSLLNISRQDKLISNIQDAEFKVFSQWGDDGIIDFLVNYIEIDNKTFIEFGVENYTECNTKFLLINKNWRGLIIDGSEKNIEYVKQDNIFWKYDLTAICKFITLDNINDIFEENGFTGNIGILSIDIDGNDYWIWKIINNVNPIIVIAEYNSIFGCNNPYTTPYSHDFLRTNAHYSNLYYGTSLQSLCDLADEKGYSFVGCNSNGNNAYFVRKDKMKDLKPLSSSEGYVLSQFAESRNEFGELSFLRGKKRLESLKGLEIYNTRTNLIEFL